ncbi:GntR family transcriptional regulator [Paraburkholderia xenovorans]|uniref:GntR family transcriptional regulator n=1 Tax=Paraburkholderia xenovorans TaxID=36873 RepID=UPI0038BA2329
MEKRRAKGGDTVAEAIMADIKSGHFGNGTWLKQVDLEGRYQCTRADVRRALEALAVKGSVQRIPDRGFYVSVVDEARHKELVEVRVILETSAAPSIVERATEADIAHLTELAEAFLQSTRHGTAAEKYETNRAFHIFMTRLCANRELANLAVEVRGHIPATPISQWHSQARLEQSASEHFHMIDAIANRRVEALQELLRLHILQPDV